MAKNRTIAVWNKAQSVARNILRGYAQVITDDEHCAILSFISACAVYANQERRRRA